MIWFVGKSFREMFCVVKLDEMLLSVIKGKMIDSVWDFVGIGLGYLKFVLFSLFDVIVWG